MDHLPANATRLLHSVAEGDESAAKRLVPLLYDELRQIADRVLRVQRGAHTLQPTELVHEAYARLVGRDTPPIDGALHFKRLAARVMRSVLVDRARARRADKRGGGRRQVTLDAAVPSPTVGIDAVIDSHEGLERLALVDEQAARIVELRLFGGMTVEETAAALGIAPRTVDRGWRFARAWFLTEHAAEP